MSTSKGSAQTHRLGLERNRTVRLKFRRMSRISSYGPVDLWLFSMRNRRHACTCVITDLSIDFEIEDHANACAFFSGLTLVHRRFPGNCWHRWQNSHHGRSAGESRGIRRKQRRREKTAVPQPTVDDINPALPIIRNIP